MPTSCSAFNCTSRWKRKDQLKDGEKQMSFYTYHQSFDIEGETGIVVRGIGTAVTIVKEDSLGGILDQHSPDGMQNQLFQSINENAVLQTTGELQPSQNWLHSSGKFLSSQFLRYRTISSSSDGGDGVDQGLASIESPENVINEKHLAGKMLGLTVLRKGIEDMEFPFFTIVNTPPGFLIHLGQIVSARSVKLLDKVSSADLIETRITWWHELRSEVKLHAKSLGCNAVIGYSEVTTICEDLIILTSIGTAAIVYLPDSGVEISHPIPTSERISDQVPDTRNAKQMKELKNENINEELILDWGSGVNSQSDDFQGNYSIPITPKCSQCHVPYFDTDLVISVALTKCRICKQGSVPDVLFTTIEPPEDIPINGMGCFLQARVCRQKKKEKGEALAENVSQLLPFLEYELHQQMMNKLKIKGMNALFSWKTQISIGDQFIIGLVSATAVYLNPLPAPPIFIVAASKHSSSEEERQLMEIQKKIIEVTSKNKRHFNLVDTLDLPATPPNTPMSQSYNTSQGAAEGDVVDPRGHLDLANGVKEAYILEMDDKRDDTFLSHLLDCGADTGAAVYGIQSTPGYVPIASESQFLTVFQQRKFSDDDFKSSVRFSSLCDDLLKGLQFKVRSLRPCCLVKVSFDVEIPEDDFLQVTVTAAAINVVDESNLLPKSAKHGSLRGSCDSGDDMVFQMDSFDTLTEKTTEKTQGSQLPLVKKAQGLNVDRRNQGSASDLSQSWPRSQFVKVKEAKDRLSGSVERRPSLTLSGLIPRWISGSSKDKCLSQTDLFAPLSRPSVVITPQSWLPNHRVNQYLGSLNLFFIRESTSIKEDGGSNMFMQSFISEVHSVLKAHVVALGGNAVTGFSLNEIILIDSPHKNQAHCLLNVSGDVAEMQPYGESESATHTLSPKRRMSSSSGDSLPSSQMTNESREILKEPKGAAGVETEV